MNRSQKLLAREINSNLNRYQNKKKEKKKDEPKKEEKKSTLNMVNMFHAEQKRKNPPKYKNFGPSNPKCFLKIYSNCRFAPSA